MRRKRGRTARDRAWGYISTHATCHVTGRGCHANALPRDNPHPLRRTRTTERTARAVCVQPMPKKKDWGEATRRSDRLTTSIEPAEPTQSEEPAEPAERITETEADQDDHAMESSDKNVLQGLTPQQVNDLLALLAQSQTEGRQATREVTPAESAFG